jgi:hypothetical protein
MFTIGYLLGAPQGNGPRQGGGSPQGRGPGESPWLLHLYMCEWSVRWKGIGAEDQAGEGGEE